MRHGVSIYSFSVKDKLRPCERLAHQKSTPAWSTKSSPVVDSLLSVT